jgi:hypothetical protein
MHREFLLETVLEALAGNGSDGLLECCVVWSQINLPTFQRC